MAECSLRDTAVKDTQQMIINLHGIKCPSRFAMCSNLSCDRSCIPRLGPRFPKWCVEMKCRICLKSWNVCKICAPRGIQKSRLTSKQALIEHNKLHMKNNIVLKRKADVINDDNIVTRTNNKKVKIVDLTEVLPDPVQRTFINHEQLKEGKKYLTSMQMTENKTESLSTITELDADINILIASLVLRVSKGERILISKIMSKVIEKIIRDQSTIKKDYTAIPIPSSENEFRRYFDGKRGILNNVPIPKINVLENGDAYVLPSDFIRLYFSMGLVMPSMVRTLDDIKNNDAGINDVWQTKKAKECLKKLTTHDSSSYKILLCEWSDGFDPNNNKSSRGSIHVTTFSMFSDTNRNDKSLSFVSTICSDKSNKNEIRRHVYDDLKKLREPTLVFNGTEFIKVSNKSFDCKLKSPIVLV